RILISSAKRLLQQNLPIPDLSRCSKDQLFDHFVGAREQVGWDGEAKRFCGFEVDHELELCRLHDWQVGRFSALENPTGVDASLAICIGETASVAHQATGCDKLAPRV